MVQDGSFTVYADRYSYCGGEIKNGCLKIDSEVYGDDMYFGSEKHYIFTKSQTKKLFSLIGFEAFIAACREGHLSWMERFLEEHDITPKTFCF